MTAAGVTWGRTETEALPDGGHAQSVRALDEEEAVVDPLLSVGS